MKTVVLALTVLLMIAGIAAGQTSSEQTTGGRVRTGRAHGGQFGLGVIIGEPTGISGKLWTGSLTAVDMAAAWSLDEPNELHLHADWLFHSFGIIKVEKGSLPIYYGVGGRVMFAEGNRDDHVGIRIPVGLAYIFATAPVDIFLEVVPILDLTPDTDLEVNAGIGVRYFF